MSRRKTISYTEKGLAILREQLRTMNQFMENTPDDGCAWHDSLWWSGEVPANIDLYEPRDWQETNKAVSMIWSEYLYELEHMDIPVIREYFLKAKELEIADLLAFSEAVNDEYNYSEL